MNDISLAPRWRVLAILTLAYVFNFIDRQIIGILAVPIKADLGLSDTQLGLMGGIAFALFYTGIGIPVAWLADRRNRVNIIAVAVGLWSAFTALCGFTQNFWQLLVARMGVGVGEAGGAAPSYSLISDYFPPEKRSRAIALYCCGIPLGSAIGIFFGGWVASHIGWRAAFMIVGAAGLPIVLLLKLGVREAPRGGQDQTLIAEPPEPFASAILILMRTPSFWLLSLGGATSSLVNYGLMFWLPSLFARSFQLSLSEVSWFYGSIILIGGPIGLWLGGWLADRLGKVSPGAYGLVPAIAALIAAPAYAIGLFAPDLTVAFVLFVIPQALGNVWIAPTVTAVQHIVPARMRTTASASFLFVNNLIGIGFGTFMFGFLSDALTRSHGEDALRYSILYGLGFYFVSVVVYLFASRHLGRDWYQTLNRNSSMSPS